MVTETKFHEDVKKLCSFIIKKFAPKMIILFGSHAKEEANPPNDIDICVVKDTIKKEDTEKEMNLFIYSKQGLDFDRPVDLILYTPEEWESNVNNPATFANLINRKGVKVYR